MEQELSNFLLANLYLCLFFLVYFAWMRHETLFGRNRAYLLVSALLSLAIPWISWEPSRTVADAVVSEAVLENAVMAVYGGGEVEAPAIDWMEWALLAYLLGVLLLSARFLLALGGILGLVWRHGAKREQGVWVVRLDASWQPFSFFNLLFWSEQPDTSDQERRQIWEHELAHIRQWHSIDILFFELISILFWLNPVCWLYRQAVRGVHEFLADEAVAGKQADKTDYATLLLGQFLSSNQSSLSNHFMNKHFLKQRVMKLHQSKTDRTAAYKMLFVLPILLLSLLIHACGEKVVEASASAKPLKAYSVIDLEKDAGGKSRHEHIFLLTNGVTVCQFAQGQQAPVDMANLSWKLERLALETDEVLAELGSSEGKKSLFEIKIKPQGTERFRLVVSTKDNTPLSGKLLAATLVPKSIAQAKNASPYKLVERIALQDLEEKTFEMNAEPGDYIVEVEGTGGSGTQGIRVWGTADGKKKFDNLYNGKFFPNLNYRCREAEVITFSITRAPDASNKGAVVIYHKPSEETTNN